MPKFAPPSPDYLGPASWHGASNNKPIRRIVIHCTAGLEPGIRAAARSTVAYSKRTSRPSSFHYCADARESVQYAYDSVVAFHAPPNQHSLGYELCCSLKDEGRDHWDQADHQAMLHIAAKDCAALALAYGIPIRRLTVAQLRAGERGFAGHVDVRDAFHQTSHWDPGPHFPWAHFLKLVAGEAEKLRRGADPVPPTPPKPAPVLEDPFVVGHQSGRWDASDEAWSAGILQLRKAGARAISLTETGQDRRMAQILPPGWGLARVDEAPGQSECSVMWNQKHWSLASEPYVTLLSETRWRRSKSGALTLPIYGLTVPLRHVVTKRALLLGVLHSPSAVDGPDGYSEDTPLRVRAHEETVDHVPEMWKVGRERHPAAARLLNADWNLDARKQWVQRWWDEEEPSLNSIWEGDLPDRGTHGPRVIDWMAFGGRLEHDESRVLPAVPGLDHKGVVARLGWKVARP